MTGNRIELLQLIADISQANPELRLGQMLTNLSSMARGPHPESIRDSEDDELITAARRLLSRLRERSEATSASTHRTVAVRS